MAADIRRPKIERIAMKKIDIHALSSQYTATDHSQPARPDGIDDRGDGQATMASLEAVQRWGLQRWPNAAKLRDNGATLRAMQEIATGIDEYRRRDRDTAPPPSCSRAASSSRT